MFLKPFLMIYKKSPSEWDEKDAEVYCRFIERMIKLKEKQEEIKCLMKKI